MFTKPSRRKKRMYLAVLSPSIFAHAVLITTNFPASAHQPTHIHTHSSTVRFICRYRISVRWVQNLLSYFSRCSKLCAGNKRRKIFSLPPRFARDWHATSQLIKLGISVTPSSLTVHLIIQSILNKIHIYFGNTTLHIAYCCMIRPRLLVITYLTHV